MFLFRKIHYAVYIAILVLLLDISSKYWVHSHLPLMTNQYLVYPYGGIGVFKNFIGIEFSISHLTNRGAAWGTLGEYQGYLLVLRILLILGLIGYLLWFNIHKSRELPLCLIIAGASGNVLDYFLYGHVVDMLHFVLWGYDFPVFNVADSAVTIGIFWLMLISPWQESNDFSTKKSKIT